MPMDELDKVVAMTQWEEFRGWGCGGEPGAGEAEGGELGRARRFIAAQTFLLAWQQGKVPVGWRRPRRLSDLGGIYPPQVLDAALARIEDAIEARNAALTARLAARLAPGRAGAPPAPGGAAGEMRVRKEDVERLKESYGEFNARVYNLKVALGSAGKAVAEAVVMTSALEQKLGTCGRQQELG